MGMGVEWPWALDGWFRGGRMALPTYLERERQSLSPETSERVSNDRLAMPYALQRRDRNPHHAIPGRTITVGRDPDR